MNAGPADTNPSLVPETGPGGPSAGEAVHGEGSAFMPPGDVRLIDELVTSGVKSPHGTPSPVEEFLNEPSASNALRLWLGSHSYSDREELVFKLNRDVAYIDRLLSEQVNAILHHPAFQQLEAAWRGLEYLTRRTEAEGDKNIEVRVLNVSGKELERDFERASDFDQSQLFRLVYEHEFGTPGGKPFGVLLADYQLDPGRIRSDRNLLKSMARVGAAAFCPVLTNLRPSMFGLDQFVDMEHQLDHAKLFEQLDYLEWRTFRNDEDARFVGLTLPRVLMRLPYDDDGSRVDHFCFREDVTGLDQSKYLWGGAAYALGGVLIRAFAQAGWLADIRGVRRAVEGGGLVTDLPVHSFSTDKTGVAVKSSTDVLVTDRLEKELSDLGFISLCPCYDTDYSAFYSTPSAQKPKVYDRPAPTINARISAMLQYMLCVSRFAHYVKVLGRDKIGAFAEPEQLERFLQQWLVQYVTPDIEAAPETKARLPLREAKVQVLPNPGKPGSYQCILHLSPHYELEEMMATVKLATELVPGSPA